MYWASIVYIQKSILHKIWKLCFSFLWNGSREEGIALVKLENVVKPKYHGGWGVKNIFKFNQGLRHKYDTT
jgi:hypothetical protein